jgi:hypothetical protein
MFLSEMLDPAQVQNIILVDLSWPMFGQDGEGVRVVPKPHQINWDHIYGGAWILCVDQDRRCPCPPIDPEIILVVNLVHTIEGVGRMLIL